MLELIEKSLDSLSYAVVDTETSGMYSQYNRVIDVGIVIVENGQIVKEWETLVDPNQDIPFWITKYTNLSNKDVVGKPTFEEVLPKISELLSDKVFVAHNVGFDYSFLREEYARAGYPFRPPRLCTVALTRKLLPHLPSANLDTLSDYYNIEIEKRHRALPDAKATAIAFLEMLKIAKQNYKVKTFFDLERLQRIRVNKDRVSDYYRKPSQTELLDIG